jgi:hypothetical protein
VTSSACANKTSSYLVSIGQYDIVSKSNSQYFIASGNNASLAVSLSETGQRGGRIDKFTGIIRQVDMFTSGPTGLVQRVQTVLVRFHGLNDTVCSNHNRAWKTRELEFLHLPCAAIVTSQVLMIDEKKNRKQKP